MSSLAATQADGYYLPPEYYEAAQNNPKLSKNQWYSQQQSKKAANTKPPPTAKTQRFELPYNALCQNCDAYLSRGTRYNATKHRLVEDDWKLEFRMTCRSCAVQRFRIQTDPANERYVYVEGLQHLERNERKHEANNQTQPQAPPSSAIEKVEIYEMGLRQAETEYKELQRLQTNRKTLFENDAGQNAVVRTQYRKKRQRYEKQTDESKECGWNPYRTRLLPGTSSMKLRAMETTFGNGRQLERKRFRTLQQSSIFASKSTLALKSNDPSAANSTHNATIGPDQVVSASSFVSGPTRKKRKPPSTCVDLTQDPPPRKKRTIQWNAINSTSTQAKHPSQLEELMAGYSSSDGS